MRTDTYIYLNHDQDTTYGPSYNVKRYTYKSASEMGTPPLIKTLEAVPRVASLYSPVYFDQSE